MTPRTVDAAGLPRTVFGHRALAWWGTLAFIVIEGTTLVVAVASYLYLRRNQVQWPPQPLEMPGLLIPTVNLALILLAIVPLRAAARAADRLDGDGIARWLTIAVALALLVLALRVFEFGALNVRWNETAYGSVVWLIMGLHTTLLIADAIEMATFGTLFRLRRQEPKHFTDIEDAALYQYFLSAAWVPLYVLVFLAPRFL